MAEIPNLAGVATKNLVETIGSGRFQASYINWSRTMNLLHEHAPGWMVDYEKTDEGYDQPKQLLHRAPVGGFLMIRFRHLDGTLTPSVPQAVMDNRNNAIPFDKITARDISDTQRRGMCMAAAMTFGLAYELWAKMPLESGFAPAEEIQTQQAPPKTYAAYANGKISPSSGAVNAAGAKASESPAAANEENFRQTALDKGLSTHAIDGVIQKLNGNWAGGLARLEEMKPSDVNKVNEDFKPVEKKTAKKAPAKAAAGEY